MSESRAVVIKAEKLTKKYKSITAVENLNLEIREGEVFGLLGPNGAGKTTTTLMLLGLTDPTSGRCEICGHNSTHDPIAVKAITGYLPDNVGFYGNLTGRQNLEFTGRMNGLSEAECAKRAERLLRRVGMTDAADRRTDTYSKGMRQRLGVADVLMKDPKIIIMDEPTSGIDPVGVKELTQLIRDLADQDGRTVLVSSHELYQIQEISDRVGIFMQGRLIACGSVEELGGQLNSEGHYMVDVTVSGALPEGMIGAIRSIPGVVSAQTAAGGALHVESSADVRKELLARLLNSGAIPTEVHQRGGSLSEIYSKYFEGKGEANVDGSARAGGGSSGHGGEAYQKVSVWKRIRSHF